jgi:hypothetical protein
LKVRANWAPKVGFSPGKLGRSKQRPYDSLINSWQKR